jgi:hypothetical protein
MHPLFLTLFHAWGLSFITNIILYIDPGTGSIILQAIAAAVAGIAIAIKIYWHSLLKFLGIRKELKSDAPAPEDQKE